MKKLRNITTALVANLVVASTVMAQQPAEVQIQPPSNKGDLGSFINAILDLAFLLAGAVAVLFLVIGGFRYVVSAGNPDQVEGAKKTILYAVLGLIIIFIAYIAVQFILQSLGAKTRFDLVP